MRAHLFGVGESLQGPPDSLDVVRDIPLHSQSLCLTFGPSSVLLNCCFA